MTRPAQYLEGFVTPVERLQLGFEDAACAMGLPVSTLEQLHRKGEAPHFFKIGRRLFTTRDLILKWQAAQIAASVVGGGL